MLTVVVLVLAVALELTVGEPPTRFHPVAWFGSLVAPFDGEWRYPLAVGVVCTVVLPLVAAGFVAVVVAGGLTLDRLVGVGFAGVAVFLSTSLRGLLGAARSVVTDSDDAVEAARDGLLALAGRDAESLSPGHLRSAAVESAAENLADGLVAPLAGFVFGVTLASSVSLPTLPVGTAVAVWIKAINTMDSMLGYRHKRVGTAAARLDDAVMWLPARMSALALAVAFLDGASLARTREWLPAVPSPNSGWPMGVAAAALDVRLEKSGVYVLNPSASLPDVPAARRGVRAVGVAGGLSYALAGAWLAVLEMGVPAWF